MDLLCFCSAIGILGQVYLIASIPDLCTLTYFNELTKAFTNLRTVQSVTTFAVLIAKMFKVFKQTPMLTYPADLKL